MACTVFHFRSDLYLLYVAVFNPMIQRLTTFLLLYIYLQSFPWSSPLFRDIAAAIEHP